MTGRNGKLNRREFVTTSLGYLATAGLATVTPGLVVRAEDTPASKTTTKNGVIYRKLGRTGMEVPIVSMGAGACNDPTVVQACYEAGMRLFDTASAYAFGRNEQMVANALHKLQVRDKVVLVTKCLTSAQRAGLTPEQSKETLKKTVEGSLKRLKTDYIDVLQLYDVRDPGPIRDQAILEAMSEIKKEGKARAIGVSTHADMANVINAMVEVGIYDVVLTSFNFTLAADQDLMGAVRNAAAKGMGIIAMKVLAGGARFPNPETLRQYSGSVINSAALKWVLRNEFIATSIPGIANFDHLRDNFAVASNLELTEEEERFLSDNSITLGMEFCRQCSKCLASCPKKADIPDLMRTHMYATQYADFRLARDTIDSIPPQQGLDACASCETCAAKCANSVNIPRKIEELKLIYG
jgi:aryl-alcohol dehydrogenase-like predicted oxidoreductase